MHADGSRWSRRLVPPVFAALLAAGPAAADAPFGAFQIQYQRLEDAALFERGDGSLELRRRRQEFFLRSLDIRQQTYFRSDLMLEASLRVSERDAVDSRGFSRVPIGGLRLVHPFLQVSASHQPGWERTGPGSSSGLAGASMADTAGREVTTRSRQSTLAAHVAAPGLPRLDVTWVDRWRQSDGGAADRSQTRSARLSMDRERYSFYASLNQSRFARGAPGSPAIRQSAMLAGGSYLYSPRKDMSFRAQYDLTGVQSRIGASRRPGIVSHAATLDGDFQHDSKWATHSNLQWRRTGVGTPGARPQTSEEGTLSSRYQFDRRAQATAVTGFRSVTVLAGGGPRDGYQKYASAMATANAPVRRRLGLTATASHTTTWDPGRSPYGVEVLSASTRGSLSRRLSADFNWQISASGDSAAAGSRYATAWALRVQGAALRSLQGHVAFRSQRSGPGLFQPHAVVRGLSSEVRWRPVPRLELIGQFNGTRLEPSRASVTSTRSLSLRFEPSSSWQCFADWTRSEQRVQVSTAGQLSGREVLTTRLQYAPSRKLVTHASLSYNDPGKAEESRRVEVTLVWSFGR